MPAAAARQELASAALAAAGHLDVTCAGGSMAPTVVVGERVRVRAGAARPGDVALLPAVGGLVLHRLIARLPGGYLVHAGDKNPTHSGMIHETSVLGRADLPARGASLATRLHASLAALALRLRL